jgi:hypothetical protein
MTTLHIEHPITDFDAWSSAFLRFADARRSAGVRNHRVRRPIDDPRYVVIDLEFDTPEQARSFLQFLQTKVWGDRASSPALAGEPQTMLLETAPV